MSAQQKLLTTFGPPGAAFVIGAGVGAVAGYFLFDTVLSSVDTTVEAFKKNEWAPILLLSAGGGVGAVLLLTSTGLNMAKLIPV